MTLKIKYDPRMTDQANFEELLKDCGYPAGRIADLRVAKRPEPIETTQSDPRNTEVYIEVPADLASKYSNEHQTSVTPATEGNKVFRHRYKRLDFLALLTKEISVVDSVVNYNSAADQLDKTNAYLVEAFGFNRLINVDDKANKLTIAGVEGNAVKYGANKVKFTLANTLSFFNTISEELKLTMRASTQLGKQVIFKASLDGTEASTEYTIPKGDYAGTDAAFTKYGNPIKTVYVKLKDLITNPTILDTKYAENAFEDNATKKEFLKTKLSAFNRLGTVQGTAVYPAKEGIQTPPGMTNLVKYTQSMASHTDVHGDVNTYVIPVNPLEAATYISKKADSDNKFKFSKLDRLNSKHIVVFTTTEEYADSDLAKFGEFLKTLTTESSLTYAPNGSSPRYHDAVNTYTITVTPGNDIFMSDSIYIALVPKRRGGTALRENMDGYTDMGSAVTEKSTLSRDSDGYSAIILRSGDPLPEF